MKKLPSSSLNTVPDTPPSKIKILFPYFIATIIVLHLVLFYIYYNRNIQSTDVKNNSNVVTPSNLGYNQYKDIQDSLGNSEEVVILEKQSQPVPALMTKSTAETVEDAQNNADNSGFEEYSDKQSKGKNTKTLAELLGLSRQDLVDNQGYEIVDNNGYQIDDTLDSGTATDTSQLAEDTFEGDIDIDQSPINTTVNKAINKKAPEKKHKKVTTTRLARDDISFDEADITFDEDLVFDDDIPSKKTQAKSKKQTKQTKSLAKTKGSNDGKSQAKAKKQKTHSSKTSKKSAKKHVSTAKKAKRNQPDPRESALLSVDVPQAQQRATTLPSEADQTKAKNEELQDSLSNSIADIKEINRKKIEQEIQMAKRAYDETHPQPPAPASEPKQPAKTEVKEPKTNTKEPTTESKKTDTTSQKATTETKE